MIAKSPELGAEKLWNFHRLNHELRRSDCILVLGSHDPRVAERGARLFLDGWAPLLIMSGGLYSYPRHLERTRSGQVCADRYHYGRPDDLRRRDGQEFQLHRKLIPTCTEQMVWGRGDGSTLSVLHTGF
jgi:hypothetical protein